MHVLDLILLLVGAVCFALAAAGALSARVNLVALGLTAWICVPLIHTIATF